MNFLGWVVLMLLVELTVFSSARTTHDKFQICKGKFVQTKFADFTFLSSFVFHSLFRKLIKNIKTQERVKENVVNRYYSYRKLVLFFLMEESNQS